MSLMLVRASGSIMRKKERKKTYDKTTGWDKILIFEYWTNVDYSEYKR